MTRAKDAVGAYGERVAVRFLIAQGMHILERNWRGARGEIDIIAADGDVIVFCEVKTRRTESFGTPSDALVPAKVRRLRRLAAQWLAARGLRPGPVRFDVVSIWPRSSGPADVDHLRGAF